MRAYMLDIMACYGIVSTHHKFCVSSVEALGHVKR